MNFHLTNKTRRNFIENFLNEEEKIIKISLFILFLKNSIEMYFHFCEIKLSLVYGIIHVVKHRFKNSLLKNRVINKKIYKFFPVIKKKKVGKHQQHLNGRNNL